MTRRSLEPSEHAPNVLQIKGIGLREALTRHGGLAHNGGVLSAFCGLICTLSQRTCAIRLQGARGGSLDSNAIRPTRMRTAQTGS
jgi:hypothetical protein